MHKVSGLTHNHIRSQIACGLYWCMVRRILDKDKPLIEKMQKGLEQGFAYYEGKEDYQKELFHYGRLRELSDFKNTQENNFSNATYLICTSLGSAPMKGFIVENLKPEHVEDAFLWILHEKQII